MVHGANQSMAQNMSICETQNIQTSVSKVECYVCGKGLADGHTISAKILKHGTVLFCNIHYSLQ